ncbi:MAG: RNA-binding S4 domain-containing protein [Parvularculaceae bacterium]
MSASAGSQRLDRWLWCARLFRTRAAAAAFVAEQSIRLTRSGALLRVTKPAHSLKVGDELAFVLGERLVVVCVLEFSKQRVSAADASRLYRPLDIV